MKWLLGALIGAVLAALAGAIPAEAQNVNLNCYTGTGGTGWNPASTSNPCPFYIPPSSSTTVGIAPVVCGSAVNNCVLKATPGNLYSVYAECSSACWLMVFNAAAAVTNGSTTAGIASGNLVECVPIAAGGVGGVNYLPGPPGIYTVGITAMISSTTCATLTTSTVGFIHGLIQ